MNSPFVYEENLRGLVDREAIRTLLIQYSYAVDDKDWPQWEQCFAPDARVEFPFASHDGRDGLAEWGCEALAPYQVTHHLTGNVEITLDGDTAQARSKLLAAHVPSAEKPDDHFDIAGVYHWSLVRTDADGWRIRTLRLEISYLNGADPSGLT